MPRFKKGVEQGNMSAKNKVIPTGVRVGVDATYAEFMVMKMTRGEEIDAS